MPLLEDEELTVRAEERAKFRVITAGTKLNRTEVDDLEAHCKAKATTPGELIRKLIQAEVYGTKGESVPNPELVEIVGLRLMLTNLLKPLATGQKITPEVFDAIMTEVRRTKVEVAIVLMQKPGGR